MRHILAFLASDQVARNGYKIPASVLHHVLLDKWRGGTPSLVSHDAHRPIGWMVHLGLYLEPGLACLMGVQVFPETDAESAALSAQYREYHASTIVNATSADLPKLREQLAPHLQGDEEPAHVGCTGLVGPGLAQRVAPDLFAQQDKDGLVPWSALEPIAPGLFRRGPLVLFAHRFFRRTLSRFNSLNAELLGTLAECGSLDAANVRIALDPDLVGLAESVREHIEFEYWRGPKFKDDLRQIPSGVTVYASDDVQRFFSGAQRLELRWHSRTNKDTRSQEHIFEGEELRDLPTSGGEEPEFGCRYVHSIVEEDGTIRHLDGSVRIYDAEALLQRMDRSIDRAPKAPRYTKVWRADGAVPLHLWKQLLYHGFRGNPLVGEYLGMEDAPSSDHQPSSRERSRVPYSLKEGSGVRLMVSYHPRTQSVSEEPAIEPMCFLRVDESSQPAVEEDTIDFCKILARQGVKISLPEGTIVVTPLDRYVALPHITHATEIQLNKTLAALRELLHAWVRRESDRVLTVSLGMSRSDHELRVAYLGHAKDLLSWFEDASPFPGTDVEGWVAASARAIGTTRSPGPAIDDVLAETGAFKIARVETNRDECELRWDVSVRPVA